VTPVLGAFSKKGISSFAFAPPQAVSPLVPRIVTVSRDGALGISAILNSDVQAWSSRGMLASTSRGHLDAKTEGSPKDEPVDIHSSWNSEGEWIVPEPWEVIDEPLAPAINDALGIAPSLSITDERSGRALDRHSVPSVKKTAASRSSSAAPSSRGYSPAALRRIPLGKHRRIRSASPLPLDPESGAEGVDVPAPAGTSDGLGISPAMSEAHWKGDVTTGTKALGKGNRANSTMREDISMIMRRRTMKGYGIKNVSLTTKCCPQCSTSFWASSFETPRSWVKRSKTLLM
jgi:hypothetical protein